MQEEHQFSVQIANDRGEYRSHVPTSEFELRISTREGAVLLWRGAPVVSRPWRVYRDGVLIASKDGS